MAITSAHLQEALERMMRFYRLWTNSSCWHLERERELVHLVFVQPGERGVDVANEPPDEPRPVLPLQCNFGIVNEDRAHVRPPSLA